MIVTLNEQVPSDAQAGITTMAWLSNLDGYLKRHGMGTMSYVPVQRDHTVRNMLSQWGHIMETDVAARIAWLEAHGDKYDKDNSRSLLIVVRKSIGMNLRATVDAKPKQKHGIGYLYQLLSVMASSNSAAR